MREDGYEIKTGQYISFRAEGQERFTRSKTIGENHAEERIKARIAGWTPRRRQRQTTPKGISLVRKRTMLLCDDIVPSSVDIVLLLGYNVLVILCVEVSTMAEMISVREAAVRWNITERRVATLCKNGRIAGAKKQGNRWLIPADTKKPADQRLKTGAFRKTERAPKLPLPIGVSNYCLLYTSRRTRCGRCTATMKSCCANTRMWSR